MVTLGDTFYGKHHSKREEGRREWGEDRWGGNGGWMEWRMDRIATTVNHQLNTGLDWCSEELASYAYSTCPYRTELHPKMQQCPPPEDSHICKEPYYASKTHASLGHIYASTTVSILNQQSENLDRCFSNKLTSRIPRPSEGSRSPITHLWQRSPRPWRG